MPFTFAMLTGNAGWSACHAAVPPAPRRIAGRVRGRGRRAMGLSQDQRAVRQVSTVAAPCAIASSDCFAAVAAGGRWRAYSPSPAPSRRSAWSPWLDRMAALRSAAVVDPNRSRSRRLGDRFVKGRSDTPDPEPSFALPAARPASQHRCSSRCRRRAAPHNEQPARGIAPRAGC